MPLTLTATPSGNCPAAGLNETIVSIGTLACATPLPTTSAKADATITTIPLMRMPRSPLCRSVRAACHPARGRRKRGVLHHPAGRARPRPLPGEDRAASLRQNGSNTRGELPVGQALAGIGNLDDQPVSLHAT